MAQRVIRLEVRRETEDLIPELLEIRKSRSMASRASKQTRSSRLMARKLSVMVAPPFQIDSIWGNNSPGKPHLDETSGSKLVPTRVFLYMQLRNIINLPTNNKYKLQVEQQDAPLQKLEDYYTNDRFIDLSAEDNPTFSMTITQDSIENLNDLCDSPVRLTLFRLEKNAKEEQGEGEGEIEGSQEDDLVPVAQGYIDLLQFFCKKRSFAEVKTYIYPVHKNVPQNPVDYGTVLATWHVYTLMPLLKHMSFQNMLHISFESIYNFSSELADICENLMADISFKAKLPHPDDEGIELRKRKLCSFSILSKSIIAEQNCNIKWENIKNKEYHNENSLGVQTGFKVRVHNLFNELLCTEGVDFNFADIDKSEEFALVCNSMHRYMLTRNMMHILEQAVAFDEQQLVVEIYKCDDPFDILLEGSIDLSVFMYPSVNSCRFAVELRPVQSTSFRPGAKVSIAANSTRSVKKSAGKQSTSTIFTKGSLKPKDKPTFCIVNLCLRAPITDVAEDISALNEKLNQSEKLKRCGPTVRDNLPAAHEILCEESYRDFDDLIESFIHYMIKHNIKTLVDGKKFLCCNLGNLTNRLTKLMACDFNVRFPTKTNLEFTNLMTTVYEELEQRIYKLIEGHDMKDDCTPIIEVRAEILSNMNVIKYLHEAGDAAMCAFLTEKLRKNYPKQTDIYFYNFLRDVELHNFEEAKAYQERPLKEKVLNVDYHCQLIIIYVNYMEELEEETTRDTAFEQLLRNLEMFSWIYRRSLDGWILLYCLYKSCKYLPGITFARWKYENLIDLPRVELPEIPKPRWEMYNNSEPKFYTNRGKCFYESVKLCCTLGLYKFGEIIYEEICSENTEMERYLMTATFKIMLNDVDKKFLVKTFPTEKMLNGDVLKAINAQINGSLEYARDAKDAAMKNYSRLSLIDSLDDMGDYQLGLLRYCYETTEEENSDPLVQALEKCCSNIQGNLLVQNLLMGKALYRLNKLAEAKTYFVQSTNFKMHIPDAWAYLALIHLRLGETYYALECWKYAKLDPDTAISEEILAELDKIPHSDVDLYVDTPTELEYIC